MVSSLDPVQSLDTVICGIFQIYLYNNLFNPDINSKMQNNKKLTKKNNRNVTVRNICFRPKQKWRNNTTIRTKTRHKSHMAYWHDKVPTFFRASNVSLSNIDDFGQRKIQKKHNKTNYLLVPKPAMLVYLLLLTLDR